MQYIDLDYILYVLQYWFSVFNVNSIIKFHSLKFTFVVNGAFAEGTIYNECKFKGMKFYDAVDIKYTKSVLQYIKNVI